MDVSQKIIVIIGDSLSASSTSPGAYLAAALRAKGAAVRINAKVGRSARSFLNIEDGTKIMEKEIANRPNLAIIFLGTNDLVLDPTKTLEAFKVIRDAFQSAGVDTLMIGPPSFADSVKKDGKSFNELARNIVTAGWFVFQPNYIDARPMTKDIVTKAQGRAGDLIHFTKTGAQLWGGRLADAISPPKEARRIRRGFRSEALFGWTVLSLTALFGVAIARRDKLYRERKGL